MNAKSVIGDDRALPNPEIIQTEGQVRVLVGSRQVEDGFIEVSKTVYVDTQILEEVGTEEVVVGTTYNTLELEFIQDGYSNGTTVREWFIEGVDYHNSTNAIWDNAGVTRPTNQTFTATTGYGGLSDVQKQAVLTHLGYKPLYDVVVKGAKTYENRSGVVSDNIWTKGAAWINKTPDTLLSVNAQGWSDKVLRVTADAASTIRDLVSKVVNTATLTSFSEEVGSYYDKADVDYDQDKFTWTSFSIANMIPKPPRFIREFTEENDKNEPLFDPVGSRMRS